MGNSIYRFLCGLCAPLSSEHGLHGAHPAVAALGRDILSFQSTSQVSYPRAEFPDCTFAPPPFGVGFVGNYLYMSLINLAGSCLCCGFFLRFRMS